jgi:hypothetical protein
LVRQTDLPVGWSLVSAETEQATQFRGTGCQSRELTNHVTGFAEDELKLEQDPFGRAYADLTEIVEATSSQSYATQLQHAFTSPSYQACWEAETTPDLTPGPPRPDVPASSTASDLPLGAGPQVLGVRYHFSYPPRFEEPETYVDVIEVVDGRFRASARLDGESVSMLAALDDQIATMVLARLHMAMTAPSPPPSAAALPGPEVSNYVGNFNPPDVSTFFQDVPTQGGATGHPIIWSAKNEQRWSLTPEPAGVLLTATVPDNEGLWTIPGLYTHAFAQLDADLVQVGDVHDGWIGLGCAVGNDYVAFVIDDSGDWQIDRYVSAGRHRLVLLSGNDASVRPLSETNHMTIGCTADGRSNNQLALGVNGTLLAVFNATWSDHIWEPGIYAFNANAPTRTLFTNIVYGGA